MTTGRISLGKPRTPGFDDINPAWSHTSAKALLGQLTHRTPRDRIVDTDVDTAQW